MKKVIVIIVIVVAILAIGAYVALQYVTSSLGDQVSLQLDSNVATPHKLSVDTSVFSDALTDQEYESMTWLLAASIDEIQSKIAKGELSVEKLVAYYGSRIGKLDKDYNSVIRVNMNAINQAKAMDEALASGEGLKPLTGVVVLAKDNVAVKGMNTSAGSFALSELSTSRHAFLIQTMVDQGAIILGKANLSEFSNYMSFPSASGFSTLGGQTFNPYGKFDVGGSSSGSSVAAALGLSNITIGSETSGSLIFPAGQNSVVAIKPTMGLLSRDLIIPISEAQDTAGFIGKSVADVHKVFVASLSRDDNDPMSKYYDQLDQEALKSGLEKNYLQDKTLGIVDNGTEEMKKIRADFEKLGAKVVDITIPSEAYQIDMLSVLAYGIKHDLNHFLANDAVSSPLKDLQAIVDFNKEDQSRAPFGQYYLEDGLARDLSKEDYEKMVEKNRIVTAGAIDQIMNDQKLDAIISMSNELSGLYAPAHYPAVTVPSGYRESGEPYGVTLVGGLCDDLELLKLAFSYEQGTKYRVDPK